jgi:hypothetical protein
MLLDFAISFPLFFFTLKEYSAILAVIYELQAFKVGEIYSPSLLGDNRPVMSYAVRFITFLLLLSSTLGTDYIFTCSTRKFVNLTSSFKYPIYLYQVCTLFAYLFPISFSSFLFFPPFFCVFQLLVFCLFLVCFKFLVSLSVESRALLRCVGPQLPVLRRPRVPRLGAASRVPAANPIPVLQHLRRRSYPFKANGMAFFLLKL